MPYSIEFRFNEEAENLIKKIWKDASVFYGTNYLLENGVIPHVALLVGNKRLKRVFHSLEVPRGKFEFNKINFFASGKITYLGSCISSEIVAYHKKLYDLACSCECEIDSYYAPTKWVPHLTVAQDCTQNLMKRQEMPNLSATIKSIILVCYPPTQVLAETNTTAGNR